VTLDEIRIVLHHSATVRMPRFEADATGRERVEMLEDYLNLTAVTRAELEEARLCAHAAHKDLADQWEAIKGYGMHLPNGSRHSQADVTSAKAEIRPELHAALNEVKWLIARLTEQIDRLSHMGDDQVASRLYTLITGA
jgi:hypothetical protein